MTNQKRDQIIYKTLGVTELLDVKQSQVRPADDEVPKSALISQEPSFFTTAGNDLFAGEELRSRKKELFRDLLIGQSNALIPFVLS